MNRILAKRSRFLLLVIVFLSNVSLAADENSIDCTVEPYDGKFFIELYELSARTANVFCNELIRSRIDSNTVDNRYIGAVLAEFSEKAEQILDKKGLKQAAQYGDQFSALKKTFLNFDIHDLILPEIIVQSSLARSGSEGFFESIPSEVGTIERFEIKEIEFCKSVSEGMNCKALFQDFAAAFNPYRSAYNAIYDNRPALEQLGKQWDTFLNVSKSQTPLEVWLTTIVHDKHFKQDHLVGPPSFQIIALHPQLIYDSMDKAPDGSNQELGLAVEWFGVNFWDLKLPLGISVASTYVDRPEVKDEGLGVMLHINNQYAIGWAKHDDDDSVYITIDLLKVFEDKKAKYDKYMGYLQ